MSDIASQVKEIFEKTPGRLNAAAAAGVDSVYQYDLTGDGGGPYHTIIKDGTCTVVDGLHDSPSITITMEASDFVALTAGELDGMSAFMSGKMKIAGDMGLAMKLQSLFS